MNNEVIFECRYGDDSLESKTGISCGGIAFLMGVNALFLTLGIWAKSYFIILFVLLTVVVLSVHFYHYSKEHDDTKIQVTQKKLQIIGRNGRIVRSFDLRDIIKISTVGSSSIIVRVPLHPFSKTDSDYAEYTLSGAADSNGVISNVMKQIAKLNSNSEQLPESGEQQIPLQPHVFAEEEADKLHAAQHLLNQGMISQQQFDGMLMPPQTAQRPDLSEQNADDYFRRQEMLAQQIGSGPAETAPQALNGQQAEGVFRPAGRKEEQQETMLQEEL